MCGYAYSALRSQKRVLDPWYRSYRWLWATIGVLGIEADGALNYWDISPTPQHWTITTYKKLRLSYVLRQQSKFLEKRRIFSFLFLSKYNQYKIRTNLINAWSSYSLNMLWKEEYVIYWVPGTESEINVYNMCVYKNLQLLVSCWNVLWYLHAG